MNNMGQSIYDISLRKGNDPACLRLRLDIYRDQRYFKISNLKGGPAGSFPFLRYE